MRKRLLSLLLVACMVLPLIPVAVLPALAADETYTTAFGPSSDNYVTVSANSSTGTIYQPDAWKAGSIFVTGAAASDRLTNETTGETYFNQDNLVITDRFVEYDSIATTSGPAVTAVNGTLTWGSSSSGGGGLWLATSLYSNMMSMGSNYNKTPNDGSQSTITDIKATSAIRYTAEYSGDVTINFSVTYYAQNGTYLVILHNGNVVEKYATGTLTGSVNVADVKTGDTIDFVSVPDMNYDYDSYATAGYSSFNYGYTKRGLVIDEFAITYAAGYFYEEFPTDYVWAGSTSYVAANSVDNKIQFFRWYKADGTAINVNDTNVPMDETCYAEVNPYLIQQGVIAETDTYEQAFAKYRAYLKKAAKITYDGIWSMDAVNKNDQIAPIMYFGYMSQRNPFMLRTSSSGSKMIAGFDSQYWVTEAVWDKMFDSYYAATWQGTTSQNATVPTATTPVSDIKVTWSLSLYPSGSQGNGQAWAPTTISDGAAGLGVATSNPFWARPGSKTQGAAYTWTAPKNGTVTTLKIDTMTLEENTSFQWGLMVNGKMVIDYEAVTATSKTNTASAVAAMNAKLASKQIPVKAGDQISIVFLRNSGGVRINLGATVTLDPNLFEVSYVSGDDVLLSKIVKRGEAVPALTGYADFGATGYIVNGEYAAELPEAVVEPLVIEDYYISSAASISITSKYAINVYVQADDDAIEAGVMVGGRKMAGKKQADGSWKVNVAEVLTRDLLTAEVSYSAYQLYKDGYRISATTTTVNAKDLLNAYVSGDYNASVKALAQAVLDYAEISDNWFNNTTVSNTSGVKNRLKGTHTLPNNNYMSGENDVYLATIQYVSTGVMPTYKNQFAGTEFTPDATVTEADAVFYGYEEGVSPTDAEQYKYYFSAATLNLADQIGFAIRINANDGYSLDALREGGKYAVKVVSTGNTVYYDAFLYADADKTAMAIVVDGIPAALYDQNFKFTMVEEQEDGSYVDVSATLTYSVDAWCINSFVFSAGDKLSYLAQAIFLVRRAANNYVAG